MDRFELLEGIREALSVRQVFGQPVERDGVTVIPAATVMGGGGGGGGEGGEGEGESPSKEAESQTGSGFGGGFGGVMWPAGAFEIRDGHARWLPAVDLTRVLVMGLMLAIALVRARSRRKRG